MADANQIYMDQVKKAYEDYMKSGGVSTANPTTPAGTAGTNYYVPPPSLYSGVANSLQTALKGELPQDVVNQIQQRAAEFGVASGLPGSQFAGYQGLRNLGLTSLDRIKDAEKAISQTWMTPAQQAQATLNAMQQGYENQANQLKLNQAYEMQRQQQSNAWNNSTRGLGFTYNTPASGGYARPYSRTDFAGNPIY